MKTAVAPEPLPAQVEERLYTYDELVAEMPETNLPHELWDGKLVMSPTPSFFHQEVALAFYRQLHAWVETRDLGKVIAAPQDMVLSPHRCVQPDVAYIAKARLGIIKRVIMGPADLIAEIISLQGRRRDRIEKRDLYEQHGVKEYWMIDPEARMIEVLALENGQYKLIVRAELGQTAESRLLPGFTIIASDLFMESRE
jgi:Uma2 family endonuclease